MKIEDTAIIIIPDDSFDEIGTVIPHLGVGIISGYLKKHGVRHHVRNLFREIWLRPELMRHTALFKDKERALRYAKGGSDAELEKAVGQVLGDTPIRDGMVYAFSLDMEPSFRRIGGLLCMARYLKSRCDCVSIVGGVIYHDWLKELLKFDCIDFGVCSVNLYSLCGHPAFLKLLLQLEKDSPDFSAVRGLLYKSDGRIFSNPSRGKDVFSTPDFNCYDLKRHRLKIPREYTGDKEESILVLPYKFAAGCSCNCAFCAMSRFTTHKHLEVPEILDQLSGIVEQTGCRNFMFLNPCVNINRGFALELAAGIEESGLNIRWSDSARFQGMDKEVVEAFARAGCVWLYFGLEAISSRMKKYLTKQVHIPQIIDVLELCKKNNIWVGVNLIAGFPYEEKEDIKQIATFIQEHSELIDSTEINPLMLLIYSRFFNKAEKFNIRIHDYDIMDTACGVPYDEIEGRNWEEIQAHRDWGYQYLCDAVEKSIGYVNDSDWLALLYWLHGKCKSKSEMKRMYGKLIKAYQMESNNKKIEAHKVQAGVDNWIKAEKAESEKPATIKQPVQRKRINPSMMFKNLYMEPKKKEP